MIRRPLPLFAAFILSLSIHMVLAVVMDRTPWVSAGMLEARGREALMRVRFVPETTALMNREEWGGDPAVREEALRRTLQQEVDQAPLVPEIPQEEWFAPEPVAVEAPEEDLVARADAELSSLPGDLQAESLSAEIIKVPEPKVEAPLPDTRMWAPEPARALPEISGAAAPAPAPAPRDSVASLAPPPLPLPPAPEVFERPIAPPPLAPELELPKEILAPPPEPKQGNPTAPADTREEFREWDDLLDVQVATYRPEKGAGFFRVSVTPNENSVRLLTMAKDVLFALDASGSMEGPTFEGIKAGVADSLKAILRPGDRFNIVAFRADVVALNEGLWPFTEETEKQARKFVLDLEPSGKTDIYRSLSSIARALPPGDRPFLIVLCSDGRATVGLQDSREIINALSVENRLRAGIHVFGAGVGLNRYLLRLLAYRNKGLSAFDEGDHPTARALSDFLKRLSEPILVDIRVDLSGMVEEQTFPLALPDLFRGGSLEFSGRYDLEKEIAIRLTGNVRGNLKELVYRGPLPEPKESNADIAQAWASAKAFNLVSDMLQLGESEERRREIRELAKRYRLDIPAN